MRDDKAMGFEHSGTPFKSTLSTNCIVRKKLATWDRELLKLNSVTKTYQST